MRALVFYACASHLLHAKPSKHTILSQLKDTHLFTLLHNLLLHKTFATQFSAKSMRGVQCTVSTASLNTFSYDTEYVTMIFRIQLHADKYSIVLDD